MQPQQEEAASEGPSLPQAGPTPCHELTGAPSRRFHQWQRPSPHLDKGYILFSPSNHLVCLATSLQSLTQHRVSPCFSVYLTSDIAAKDCFQSRRTERCHVLKRVLLLTGLDGAERSVPGDSLPEIHNLLQRVAAGEIDPALAATHITSASQQVRRNPPALPGTGSHCSSSTQTASNTHSSSPSTFTLSPLN